MEIFPVQTLATWMGAGPLSAGYVILLSALLTIVLEAITCLFRFRFDLRATRDTRGMAKITGGLRIHHGYIGILLLALAPLLGPPAAQTFVILGVGLALSDAIHHFLVLWPITGGHEFDLRYPAVAKAGSRS